MISACETHFPDIRSSSGDSTGGCCANAVVVNINVKKTTDFVIELSRDGRMASMVHHGTAKSPRRGEGWTLFTNFLLLFRGRADAGLAVLTAEALDAPGGVDQLLLAGEERVTARADFHVNVAAVSGTGSKCVSAGAVHAHFVISGMNSCFHGVSKL